jgi:hypothetical protein
VYANQPSPYREAAKGAWIAAAVFIALAVLIQLFALVLAENRLVHEESFRYTPAAAEKSVVTSMFELTGRQSNVVIRSSASLNNSWIYLNMALINDNTGTAYDVGREIGYYTGRDEDGPWTEGSTSDEVTIPAVPSGRYYLRVEPEGGAGAVYKVAVYRDVPSWKIFIVAVVLLLFGPVIAGVLHLSFENRRWAESDHPWSRGNDDDDDE